MPLYEYECEACGKHFELIRKFSDPPVDTCFTCGGPVRKLLSSPAIQFKGSGWYITDYARKGATPSETTEPSSEAKKPAATTDSSTSKPAAPAGPSSSDS